MRFILPLLLLLPALALANPPQQLTVTYTYTPARTYHLEAIPTPPTQYRLVEDTPPPVQFVPVAPVTVYRFVPAAPVQFAPAPQAYALYYLAAPRKQYSTPVRDFFFGR